MINIDLPPEMVPFVQCLQNNPNDYSANKALASYLVSNRDTFLHSADFFEQVILHDRSDDPDHKAMLESYTEVLLYKSELEDAIKLLHTLVNTYPNDSQNFPRLVTACFSAGWVQSASNTAKSFVTHLYELAKEEAKTSGAPITQVLEPRNVLQFRFGELAYKLDLYAKARILALTPEVRALLPLVEDEVVNSCLYECLEESLSDIITFPSNREERDYWDTKYHNKLSLEFYIDPDNRGLDCVHFYQQVQKQWEEQGLSPLVTFPKRYDVAGKKLLLKLGIPEDSWFVCFHVRTVGFHEDPVSADYNYHRDNNIEDYFLAMLEIRKRGGWIVRIGDSSMPPLPEMDGVIDYACCDWREDWIDVFLLARCRFMVSTTSGPHCIAEMFGVPVVETNSFPFRAGLASTRVIAIFKLYRWRESNRYLTLEEMVSPEFLCLFGKNSFDSRGIEVIDNSSEDIHAAVIEMMDQCDSLVQYTADDASEQQRFKAIIDIFKAGFNPRIGRDFLRKYRLLPEQNGGLKKK